MYGMTMADFGAPAAPLTVPSVTITQPEEKGGTDAVTKPSTDLKRAAKKLTALVAQPYLRGNFSYGGEFRFHFGPSMRYNLSCFGDKGKGTWILGTRASGWQLLHPREGKLIEVGWPSELLSGATLGGKWMPREAKDKAVIEEAVNRLLSGAIVMYVQVLPLTLGFGFTITFTNGATLLVCPDPEPDDVAEPLADWELFFNTQHRFLRCGPGHKCSYLRSDVVDDEEAQDEEPA